MAGSGAIQMNLGSGFTSAICVGVALSFLSSMPAMAASMVGDVGDKRRGHVAPTHSKDQCGKAWDAYVAAPGHSAYAQTPYFGAFVRNGYEAYFCGAGLNASSQQLAEKRALANCNAAKKKYKVGSVGSCEVVASK